MRVALLQMNSGIDPDANAATIEAAIAEAAAGGATMLFTPEMSGLLDRDRKRADGHLRDEREDPALARACAAAKAHGIWVALGSLAVRGSADGRLANRSFVIDAAGEIVARYDKMHMFDVDVGAGDSWRESAAYAPGSGAVTVETPLGTLGLTICYDLRFPALHAALSNAGATVIAAPAAFTVPTGEAHWHVLQRARAIENAAFVVAAAQTGEHQDGRRTFGHSLVIDPWGKVLLDMGDAPGVAFCDIELTAVDEARSRVPVIKHRRPIESIA
ncbi:Deaminated glutathione amidase [Sphingomonas antarctica]|uniref:carbon-nitrogen hydrolase family protein n=1 Tax=Sphingomonas antarctica TaxID=2040274 RepID=UPI0039E78B56